MPRRKNQQFETFNDGNLNIYEVENRKVINQKAHNVRFGWRTIGQKRFHDAAVVSVELDKMVAVLMGVKIEQKDLVIINGIQYKIDQIQEKFDSFPPCKYISLQKNVITYEVMDNVD